MDPTPTRTLFQSMASWEVALFYVAAFLSVAAFLVGAWRLWRRYRLSGNDLRSFRVGRAARAVVTHAGIGRDSGVVGLAHAMVFYGFLVLFAGTVILTIDEHVAKPMGWAFFHDAFYSVYSLFLDVFGAAMLVGLVILGVRRARGGVRLDYARVDGREPSAARARYRTDDWVFFWSLMIIGASGFLLESVRIAIDKPAFEVWSPVGYGVGSLLSAIGLSGASADVVHHAVWWIHGIAALGFVAAIPFTKAMHMLTGPGALAARNADAERELPADPETGYATLADVVARHRLDLDACTKCGRCHEVCPARQSGMPLSPRDLVLDLREAQSASVDGALAPGVVLSETLWSCMQCNACVDVCPVGVEHAPIITLMRRGLVESGELDPLLAGVLQKIQTTGNSFGSPPRKRTRWIKELDVALIDAREQPVDVLWYLGDFASLDPRNLESTKALAQVLQRAGVEVGCLYDGEKTAGNDVRRAGEEGLFRMLAADNIAALTSCTFNRILTTDPHTYNTLRNEYPRLGAPWSKDQVVHHTVLLAELFDAGRLTVTQPIGGVGTYHDPCTLGRINGVFDEPRELIRRVGIDLVEMPRNRLSSFCCGAGGGRIWMEDTAAPGSARPSDQRIAEAAGIDGLAWFIVACPKDAVMYDDALRTAQRDDIAMRDISQLVLAATTPVDA